MSRRRTDPLRALSDDERRALERLSRSHRAAAAQVARAAALLAVADGRSYSGAARRVGRRDGDTVAAWGARFNREGLAAVRPARGGGRPVRYADAQQRRILAEAARVPDRERDGTATWSLGTLHGALRRAGVQAFYATYASNTARRPERVALARAAGQDRPMSTDQTEIAWAWDGETVRVGAE